MKKLIRDGAVAILYSPKYGSGWYTANKDRKELLYTPEIVEIVEKYNNLIAGIKENNSESLREREKQIYKIKDDKEIEIYTKIKELELDLINPDGVRDLQIEWMVEGQLFKIEEYDGYERIEYLDCGEVLLA